jgi:hypothetical protein
MTTIVYDPVDKTIAVDSLVSSKGVYIESEKVLDYPNNEFAFLCGDIFQATQVANWVNQNMSFEEIQEQIDSTMDNVDFVVTYWFPKLKYFCHFVNSGQPVFSSLDQKFAFGSGYKIAIAAIDIGLTARQAIKLASKLDSFTGGEIVDRKLCMEA